MHERVLVFVSFVRDNNMIFAILNWSYLYFLAVKVYIVVLIYSDKIT